MKHNLNARPASDTHVWYTHITIHLESGQDLRCPVQIKFQAVVQNNAETLGPYVERTRIRWERPPRWPEDLGWEDASWIWQMSDEFTAPLDEAMRRHAEGCLGCGGLKVLLGTTDSL